MGEYSGDFNARQRTICNEGMLRAGETIIFTQETILKAGIALMEYFFRVCRDQCCLVEDRISRVPSISRVLSLLNWNPHEHIFYEYLLRCFLLEKLFPVVQRKILVRFYCKLTIVLVASKHTVSSVHIAFAFFCNWKLVLSKWIFCY